MSELAVTHLEGGDIELRVHDQLVYRGPDQPLELWRDAWYLPRTARNQVCSPSLFSRPQRDSWKAAPYMGWPRL